jgi:hypothetical protein
VLFDENMKLAVENDELRSKLAGAEHAVKEAVVVVDRLAADRVNRCPFCDHRDMLHGNQPGEPDCCAHAACYCEHAFHLKPPGWDRKTAEWVKERERRSDG